MKTSDADRDRQPWEQYNPFLETVAPGPTDEELVAEAQTGKEEALEELVRRHQTWILNLAIRMLGRREVAEDATQEILIKSVTKLSTFQYLSRFRTWLYRITINHLLNARKSAWEEKRMTFTDMGQLLDRTPDLDLPDPNSVPAELPLIIEETSVTCMSGMLMCLERRQRMAFILGEIFGVTGDLGGEVIEISAENFRKLLSRARRDLYQFMQEKCGLINHANPCRCAKKTRSFIQAGYVDPVRLQFTKNRQAQINEIAPDRLAELQGLERKHGELFRRHGFLKSPDFAVRIRELIRGFDP